MIQKKKDSPSMTEKVDIELYAKALDDFKELLDDTKSKIRYHAALTLLSGGIFGWVLSYDESNFTNSGWHIVAVMLPALIVTFHAIKLIRGLLILKSLRTALKAFRRVMKGKQNESE